MGNFSKRIGPLVQRIVVAERRNLVMKEIGSIREAPIDGFGISTCVLLEALLIGCVTECLTLSNLVESKSR
jgi:hypothetical protein